MSTPSTNARTGWLRHAWILVLVLVVGVALFLAVERTLVATQNPNMVPTTILLGAAVVPATFVAFIYGRRLQYAVANHERARAARHLWMSAEGDVSGVHPRSNPVGVHLARWIGLAPAQHADLVAIPGP